MPYLTMKQQIQGIKRTLTQAMQSYYHQRITDPITQLFHRISVFVSLSQQLVTTLEQLQRLRLKEMIRSYHEVPVDIWYAFWPLLWSITDIDHIEIVISYSIERPRCSFSHVMMMHKLRHIKLIRTHKRNPMSISVDIKIITVVSIGGGNIHSVSHCDHSLTGKVLWLVLAVIPISCGG